MSKCCVYYDADANRCDYHDPISFKLGAENRQLRRERDTLTHRIDELCAENERLRQENQSIGIAAYEIGYKNGSIHYELEHCPACKNIADLQEALAENTKLRSMRDVWQENDAKLREQNSELRKLVLDMLLYYAMPGAPDYKREAGLLWRAHEMGIEVSE